jgi:hypothetical protein
VKHVDAFRKLRNVEDSMFEFGVDTHLLDTGSNNGYRLPIVRFKPLLDAPQLKPGDAARVRRKSLEVVPGRSEPKQRLVRHSQTYKYWYMLSRMKVNQPAGSELTKVSLRRHETAEYEGLEA